MYETPRCAAYCAVTFTLLFCRLPPSLCRVLSDLTSQAFGMAELHGDGVEWEAGGGAGRCQ